ncbi:tyrosine--tRNA ligase [Candidatus Berkelbacteria bacterium RBG_13_40_8]|uniref:Tyrosine--tRNA ligase n=1 Tax=Candidatus Berkelbacteria bacterium RBG_13_40_8 TaxID=1797467 RepID=A0A1F5DPE3_9BACT|nr:MAG: tyrosine--tRNA ligase [Candidatus Berkelbacteria bacterium RBG_13_40_8]
MSIDELLTRGVEEIIVRESLEKKLKSGKKLRIKFGIDPTSADLHLGHTIALRKLKQFQDLDHKIILIIGDYTATIGDPSARKEARKMLSKDEVQSNMKSYLDQVGKILDLDKTEIHYNSEWYDKKDSMFLFDLSSKVTIQRVLKRDDFQKRLTHDQDINMLETIYPLLQGYDSVEVRADLELGGTDQKFNLLMGRKIQKAFGQEPQDIMTVWLLEGTDGVHKMSKSFGNYISMSEEPNQMYGKVMSIPDELIVKYFRLLTDVPNGEVDEMLKRFRKQVSESFNPREEKARLAFEIVRLNHSKDDAKKAAGEFDRVFKNKEKPEEMPVKNINVSECRIDDLLMKCELATSKAEAKRLVGQGGVEVAGEKITDPFKTIEIKDEMIIQVGKRRFVKIKK